MDKINELNNWLSDSRQFERPSDTSNVDPDFLNTEQILEKANTRILSALRLRQLV
jgi:hypothetical protein